MKKIIILSVMIVLILLAGGVLAPSDAQALSKDDTPTFYRLVPGTYVNGYPRFTITYPKDWIERRPAPQDTFRAGAPGPALTDLVIVAVVHNPTPLDKLAAQYVAAFRGWSTEVTVVSDRPAQLRDGTPAREVELKYLRAGAYINWLSLTTRGKGDLKVVTGVASGTDKIGEHLKAILYSRQHQPDKDEPVKVSADIREFLDGWCNDLVAHDVAKVMSHYSDRYLDSGTRKKQIEEFNKQNIGGITSHEVGITEFVPAGDRAYLSGFVIVNETRRWPLHGGTSVIIKENGEWKWYGNQRDPAP